jgi:hypothetical protein
MVLMLLLLLLHWQHTVLLLLLVHWQLVLLLVLLLLLVHWHPIVLLLLLLLGQWQRAVLLLLLEQQRRSHDVELVVVVHQTAIKPCTAKALICTAVAQHSTLLLLLLLQIVQAGDGQASVEPVAAVTAKQHATADWQLI